MMPPDVAMRTYEAHKTFYDKLQRDVAKAAGKSRVQDPDAALANAHAATSARLTRIGKKCKAAVILISGCQDNQTSMDGDENGAFTEQLLQVWDTRRLSRHLHGVSRRDRRGCRGRRSPICSRSARWPASRSSSRSACSLAAAGRTVAGR